MGGEGGEGVRGLVGGKLSKIASKGVQQNRGEGTQRL